MIDHKTYQDKSTLDVLLGEVVTHRAFEKFEVTLYDSSILRFNIFRDQTLTLEDFELYKNWIEQANIKKCYVLISSGSRSEVDDSFKNAALHQLNISIAEAIIVSNLAQRIIANVYVRFEQPKIPTRVFTEEENAAFWLMSFR